MTESQQLVFARLAARANRAGIDRESLETLTVAEAITLINEADEERRAWDRLTDHRTAALMALIANCHRKKGAQTFKPSDFLPAAEAAEPATDEDMENQFHAFAAALNAK